MSKTTASKPLYAWYGDDFTGSTDVLEGLAVHGVRAVLFTHPPAPKELKAFPDCRAVGIAGQSRSRSPRWMDSHLPPVFEQMRGLGAPINHYKVCSTFDSSPRAGSIGRAMELGRTAFAAHWVPVVVGAPHLGRSVVFGNLFASAGDEVYRIDRHPTMKQHPVTPMTEADLRLHLARQTSMRMGLVNLAAFQRGIAEERLREELKAGAEAVIFDGIDDAMLEETGRLLWEQTARAPLFAVGSSGLTYGLMAHWRRLGLIQADAGIATLKPAAAADRLLVLSGSCSPVTARQIREARRAGFSVWHLESPGPWAAQMQHALKALAEGKSVVLYTALGPVASRSGYGKEFGAALGRCLRKLVQASGTRRVLIAGGDTSTHAVKQLGINALTFAAPLIPGVPLCRCHAPGSPLDGLELALKGGQMGSDDFFAQVCDGR